MIMAQETRNVDYESMVDSIKDQSLTGFKWSALGEVFQIWLGRRSLVDKG